MGQLKHLMIDLETLGTSNNSVILSISAVEFDIETGETFREFNTNIDIQSCLDAGLSVDGSTINWWLNQSKDAISSYSQNEKHTLIVALINFREFILNNEYDVFWGNGVRFDLGILDNAFKAAGVLNPIQFWKERDVRTLVSLYPEIKEEEEFIGIPHYGIDDCKHQIKYCSKIYNKLKS